MKIFVMNKVFYKIIRKNKGFSLAEVLVALILGSMILVSVLGLYRRVDKVTVAVTERLNSSRIGFEVLQRIAEDLDNIVTSSSDVRIIVSKSKLDHLYSSGRLEISKTIYNKKNKKEMFEKVVWQSGYDYDSEVEGLVLYRSHSGMILEDKLLDEKRESWEEEYSFIPMCEGVSFFRIQALVDGQFRDSWSGESLPHGVSVTISFAEPFKTIGGYLDVPEEEKHVRTIALDRTRKIKFIIEEKEEKGLENVPRGI